LAESADIAVIDGENIADVSPWELDSVVEDAGNGFDLSAIAAIHNDYGYRVSFGGVNDSAYAQIDYDGHSDTYVRQYLRFEDFALPNNNDTILMYPILQTNQQVLGIYFFWHSATSKMGYMLYLFHAGGASAIINKSAIDVFTQGIPYYMELHYKKGGIGTGGCEMWIDGVSQGSDFTTYNCSYEAYRTRVGVNSGAVPVVGSTIYIDDILVSTTGPIGPFTGWWAPTFHSDTLDGLSTLAERELNDNYSVTEETYPQISVYRGWLRNFQGCILLHGSEK
jgi:hypothetical protein